MLHELLPHADIDPQPRPGDGNDSGRAVSIQRTVDQTRVSSQSAQQQHQPNGRFLSCGHLQSPEHWQRQNEDSHIRDRIRNLEGVVERYHLEAFRAVEIFEFRPDRRDGDALKNGGEYEGNGPAGDEDQVTVCDLAIGLGREDSSVEEDERELCTSNSYDGQDLRSQFALRLSAYCVTLDLKY